MSSEAGENNNGGLSTSSKLQISSQTQLQPDNNTIKANSPDNEVTPIASSKSTTDETLDLLRKELDRLKARLEEERKKLNDVACKYFLLFQRLNRLSPNLSQQFPQLRIDSKI